MVVLISLSCAQWACVSVDANISYIDGTQDISDDRHDEAITALTEATRLDQKAACSFNNLASACFAAGRIREGWPHVRRACSLDQRDHSISVNLRRHLGQLIHDGELGNGSGQTSVLTWLGEPDTKQIQPEGETWQYGSLGVRFADQKLVGAIRVDQPSTKARRRPCAVCGSG